MGKIISSTILKKTIKNLKKKNLSLVVTNGCFDIIHPGHIKIFEESKNFGITDVNQFIFVLGVAVLLLLILIARCLLATWLIN